MKHKKKYYSILIACLIAMWGCSVTLAQPKPMEPAKAPVMAVKPVPTPTMAVKPKAVEPKAEVKEKPKSEKAKKQDSWWKVLIGGLINILLLFVLAISTALGGLLVKWIAKKAKITDQEQIKSLEALYNLAVGFGINFAKQQAKKLSNDPDSKAKRLEWAVEKAQEFIEEWKLPQKTADWLKKRIEAKIGKQER